MLSCFWPNHFKKLCESRFTQTKSTHLDATTKIPPKWITIFFWHYKVLTGNSQSMYTCMQTDLHQSRIDLEQNIPRLVWKGKGIHQKDTCMVFYDKKRTLYLVTNASRLGMSVGLLQVRDRWDTRQHNIKTHSIWQQEFIKCWETLQQHWTRSTWNNPRMINIPSLLFCKRCKKHNRPQMTYCYIQKRCDSIITMITVHTI